MRHLYLLRGTTGAGKSSFIEEYGLEKYTISIDKVRQQHSNPIYKILYNEEGEHSIKEDINPNIETKVWDSVMEMLESRMSRGETTIIDATHSTIRSLQAYNKLVERYRYRIFTIQLDVTSEQAHIQNEQRPEVNIVPPHVVDKKINQIENSTPKVPKKYGLHRFDDPEEAYEFLLGNTLWKAKEIKPEEYKHVYLIGDIHASYTTLKEAIPEIREDSFYVFHGDYLDRGLEPYETVKYLHEIYNKPNVVLLRGNHEENYENWFRKPHEQFKSKVRSSMKYIKELQGQLTKEEFTDFTKKLKDILHKVQDIFTFTIGNDLFISTHGGVVGQTLSITLKNPEFELEELVGIPLSKDISMLQLSSDMLVRGIGRYEDNIDKIFTKDAKMLNRDKYKLRYTNIPNIIQTHGHRNSQEMLIQEYSNSWNLEQGVENGGLLAILKIDTESGEVEDLSKENTNYRITFNNTLIEDYPVDKFFEQAKDNEHLKIKQLKTVDNVYSVNFTRDAFYDRVWNNMTIRARGLFINPKEGRVVARSYDKFFNLHETKYSELENLTYPVKVSAKANGFLGILTYEQGKPLFLTKSTDFGDHVELFKDTFYKTVNHYDIDLEELEGYLKHNDVSMVFEVVDNGRDPHIINTKHNGVVLLNVFENSLKETSVEEFSTFNFPTPEEKIIQSEEELKSFLNSYNKDIDVRDDYVSNNLGEQFDTYGEGFVIEDSEGFRIKIKSVYYNTWKGLRTVLHKVIRGKRNVARTRFEQEFEDYLDESEVREIVTDSILLERLFFLKYLENNK